jgi:DGQHR domain-containing protein
LGQDKLYKKGRDVLAKGYIPNSIVLNLSDDYEVKKEKGGIYIIFPDISGVEKLKETIEIIDGQHRLLAFDDDCRSKLSDYGMCFVAFKGLTNDEKREVFMVLNERQKTVDKNILLKQKKLLNLLLEDEETRYVIISRLNEDSSSPFKGKIIMAGEKIKFGLKAKQIDEIFSRSKAVEKLMNQDCQISDIRYKILVNYYNAWKACFSSIWSKNNTLTKISGFRFMSFLFPSVYDVINNRDERKKDFRLEEFKKIISQIRDDYFNKYFDINKADCAQYFQEKSGTIKFAESIGRNIYNQYKDKEEDIIV